MIKKSLFEKDFLAVEDRFPKLKYFRSNKFKGWIVTGELDICDIEGIYWDTFDIIMLVPKGYPYCVPILFEKSKIIPRDVDWHISNEGACCYDIDHNLIALSKKGIYMPDFIAEKIYSYFANQLYKISEKKYAGQEYAHYLEGTIQYYEEEHKLLSEHTIVLFLERIISSIKIGRNDDCPCGSGLKVKRCHFNSIKIIKSLGSAKIKNDIESIKANITQLKSSRSN
jgi:hypothetical protein